MSNPGVSSLKREHVELDTRAELLADKAEGKPVHFRRWLEGGGGGRGVSYALQYLYQQRVDTVESGTTAEYTQHDERKGVRLYSDRGRRARLLYGLWAGKKEQEDSFAGAGTVVWDFALLVKIFRDKVSMWSLPLRGIWTGMHYHAKSLFVIKSKMFYSYSSVNILETTCTLIEIRFYYFHISPVFLITLKKNIHIL